MLNTQHVKSIRLSNNESKESGHGEKSKMMNGISHQSITIGAATLGNMAGRFGDAYRLVLCSRQYYTMVLCIPYIYSIG